MTTQPQSTSEINNVVQLRPMIGETQLHNATKTTEIAKEQKREFCDEVLEFVTEQLFVTIRNHGFLSDPQRVNHKDMVMVEQAVQAVLYRNFDLPHPMYEVNEKIITLTDKQGNVIGEGDDDGDPDEEDEYHGPDDDDDPEIIVELEQVENEEQ